MKIISVSVKAIDDKGHVRILSLADVDVTIKGPQPSPITEIPEITEMQEAPKQTKKQQKKKK